MSESSTPIRDHRIAAGLTQAELAETVGIDHTHLSRIERGERSPSVRVLMRLCEALALEPAQRLDLLTSVADPGANYQVSARVILRVCDVLDLAPAQRLALVSASEPPEAA